MNIASLVLGIVGLVSCINIFSYPLSIICGLLAIIFGLIGRNKEQIYSGKGKAGITMGIISIIFSVIVIVLVAVGMNGFISSLPKLLEEIAELIENEKELFLNEITQSLESSIPWYQ